MHLHYQIHKTKKKTKNKVFFLQFNTNVLHSSYKIEILLVFTFFTLLLNLSKIINDKCKSTIPPLFFSIQLFKPNDKRLLFLSFFFLFFAHETQKVAFNWKTFHRLQFVRCSLSPPEHDCSLIHGVKQPPILSPGFFQFRVNIPPPRILSPIILPLHSPFRSIVQHFSTKLH